MVVVESQFFDIQPQKDNNNYLFNDLVNVVPTAHPWTGLGYRQHIDVREGDKDRHWLRKRRGFKKVPLYIRGKNCQVAEEANNSEWANGEFTDMAIFEGRRWFLRVNQYRTKIRLYVQWFANSEECSGGVYSDITEGQIINVTPHINGEDSMPFSPCSFDRFTSTRGLRYNNGIQNNNPEGDRVLRAITVGTATERVLYDRKGKASILPNTAYIRLNDSGMVVENGGGVCKSVADTYGIPENSIFVNGAMSLQYQFFNNKSKCEVISEIGRDAYINEIKSITTANKLGTTLSFVTLNGLSTISAYGQMVENNGFPGCFNVDVYDIPGSSNVNNGINITSIATINDRLAIMRDNNTFVISGAGQNQTWFPAGDLTLKDKVIGIHSAPLGVTDIIGYDSFLVLVGPHETHYFKPDYNSEFGGVFQITDRSGYFSKNSWINKDGKIFMLRSYNDLYYLEGSVAYGNVAWIWNYYSSGVHSHIRHLDKTTDKVHIDMTDNNAYVIIYDNNPDSKYSKILIQDRQYNFWYTWVMDGVRITRVKGGIFFGDYIYSYEGVDDNGKSITEIISATRGDETIQATKHFELWKMALGKHSKITNNTKLETTVLSGGEKHPRIVPITTTRFPTLIEGIGSEDVVKRYDIGKEIRSERKEKSHSLQNEILEYQGYKPKDERLNPLDKSYVSDYAQIREAVNLEGEIIQLVITASGTDEVEFGGMFIGYYYQDFDFGDIAESIIDPDIPTYQSERISHELDRVEDPEVLGHF